MTCDSFAADGILHLQENETQWNIKTRAGRLPTLSMLSEENTNSESSGKFKCKECDKEFCYRRNYVLHHMAVHGQHPKPIAPCGICRRKFNSLTEYGSTHGLHCPFVKKYYCGQCRKNFLSKSMLDQHKKFHRKFSSELTCQLCTRSFSHKRIFRTHVRAHMGKRLYCCQTCGKNFLNDTNLLQHESLHGSYVCSECHRTFSKLHQLKHHRLKDHGEGGTGHKCSHCGAAFADANRLRSHAKNCDAPGPSSRA